ncbi:hypothetical protein BGW38_006388, partial [Lunasporangiospora selenospora]
MADIVMTQIVKTVETVETMVTTTTTTTSIGISATSTIARIATTIHPAPEIGKAVETGIGTFSRPRLSPMT